MPADLADIRSPLVSLACRSRKPALRTLAALVVLERMFVLLHHEPLVNALASSLLLGEHAITTLVLRRYCCEDLQPPPVNRHVGEDLGHVGSPSRAGTLPRTSSREHVTDDRFPGASLVGSPGATRYEGPQGWRSYLTD